MRDAVRRLDVEYGFNLTDQEIDLVAKQAEETALLLRPMFDVDLTNVAPLTTLDRRANKSTTGKKAKK